MSDVAEYTIILFESDIPELKEILEMSLNLIFFHRNLSNNDLEDAQGKLTNITYVKLKNETLCQEITNTINEIEKIFSQEPKLYGYNISLSFFEKSEKRDNPWERWNFISVMDKKEDLSKKSEVKDNTTNSNIDKENKVREYMFKLIEKLNDKGNHMPIVDLNDNNLKNETFSHKFKTVKVQNKEEYLSLFNNYMQKNQDDIIVINI